MEGGAEGDIAILTKTNYYMPTCIWMDLYKCNAKLTVPIQFGSSFRA